MAFGVAFAFPATALEALVPFGTQEIPPVDELPWMSLTRSRDGLLNTRNRVSDRRRPVHGIGHVHKRFTAGLPVPDHPGRGRRSDVDDRPGGMDGAPADAPRSKVIPRRNWLMARWRRLFGRPSASRTTGPRKWNGRCGVRSVAVPASRRCRQPSSRAECWCGSRGTTGPRRPLCLGRTSATRD